MLSFGQTVQQSANIIRPHIIIMRFFASTEILSHSEQYAFFEWYFVVCSVAPIYYTNCLCLWHSTYTWHVYEW